jgi:hypothetical protein
MGITEALSSYLSCTMGSSESILQEPLVTVKGFCTKFGFNFTSVKTENLEQRDACCYTDS